MASSDEELDIRFYRLKSDKIGVTDSYVTICNNQGFIYEKEDGYWRLRAIGLYYPNEILMDQFRHWYMVSPLEVLVVTGLGREYIKMRHREIKEEGYEHVRKQHSHLG